MAGETILLIDKDAEITQSIESTLESNDYLVFTAPSGDVGITMANKISPALIFVNPTVDLSFVKQSTVLLISHKFRLLSCQLLKGQQTQNMLHCMG
jgi:ActR/RegA family two-component response regulator